MNLIGPTTIERIVKSIVVESITTTADDRGRIKKTKLQMLERKKRRVKMVTSTNG